MIFFSEQMSQCPNKNNEPLKLAMVKVPLDITEIFCTIQRYVSHFFIALDESVHVMLDNHTGF